MNTQEMSYKSVPEALKDEIRYHQNVFSVSFFFRILGILLAVAVLKGGLNPFIFDPAEYSRQLRTHSDYRKFDGILRMIIDCTSEEREQIEAYLDSLHESGERFYGMQTAEESLMTCYVENVHSGGHLRFVDGGGGGYALASKQLKDQIREADDTAA